LNIFDPLKNEAQKAHFNFLRINFNQNRLTDRLNRRLTDSLTDRLPTALTALTALTDNFEINPCRLNVGKLTDLTDHVG
jgi:hypothetical protein